MRQKRGLLLFLATCIPGCGQMHQGYMKRGVSLLLAFCAVLALAIFLALGELAIFLPLVWLYAFFDSYNLRSRIAQNAEPEDAYLFGLSDVDSEKLRDLCRRRHSVIGWALVALGVFLLYRIVVSWIMGLLSPFLEYTWGLYEVLAYDVPRLLATVLIIGLGLWFLRGPRKVEDDIPIFTPPAGPSGPAGPAEESSAGGEGAAPHAAPVWDAPAAPDIPVVSPRQAEGEEAPRGDG